MPVTPFRLSPQMKRKRRDGWVFLMSLMGGASAGALASIVFTAGLVTSVTFVLILIFTILLVTSILGTLWLIVNPPEIDRLIPVSIFYERSTGTIISVTDRRGFYLSRRTMGGNDSQAKELTRLLNTQASKESLLLDLAISDCIDVISHEFTSDWATDVRYTGRRAYRWKTFRYPEGNRIEVTLEQLMKGALMENKLYAVVGLDNVGLPPHFWVPNGTTISCSEDKSTSKTLMFFNTHCSIELQMFFREIGVGLSGVSTNNLILPPGANPGGEREYLQSHFAHVHFELGFRAKFSRWRGLFSSSDDYFNWAEDMFDVLNAHLNFDMESEALEQSGEKIAIR